MCSASDDPTTYDEPVEDERARRARGCQNPLWIAGATRPCGSSMGLRSWTDAAGNERQACGWHEAKMRRRYPEAVTV